MRRIALDILILIVTASTIWYLYTTYGDVAVTKLFGQQVETIYIESLALRVTVANDDAERKQGLSGVTELKELEGKLFVFDEAGEQGMWMKDMLMPIDIIWVNDDMQIVHIEERVAPNTYPKVFRSPVPARFVIEVNAFFVESFKIAVGDQVMIPAGLLPRDLREGLLFDERLQ